MKIKSLLKTSFLLTLASMAMSIPVKATTLNFYSGATGNYSDNNVHFVEFGTFGTYVPFDYNDPSNFSNARNGANALIDTGAYQLANEGLPSNANAQWLYTQSPYSDAPSALYAISFVLPQVSSASLYLEYAVDDALGFNATNGAFINGTSLNNLFTAGSGTYSNSDITPYLTTGTNTLYLYDYNAGGPAAIKFSATVDFTAVPEPSTYTLFGLGALGLIIVARRRQA